MSVKEQVSLPTQRICSRCNFVSSQEVCKACVLLEGLNKGLPKLGIGKSSKAKRMLEEYHAMQTQNAGTLVDVIKDLNDTSIAVDNSRRINNKNIANKENASNNDICNKNNCCGGSCKSKTNVDPATSNKKLDMLLEQYGLNETSNADKHPSNENGLTDTNISDHSDDETPFNGQEEDDTCSASCGGISVGF